MAYEEDRFASADQVSFYTGKVRKRLILVLDSVTAHEFRYFLFVLFHCSYFFNDRFYVFLAKNHQRSLIFSNICLKGKSCPS